jgi:hypothetical protein
MLELFEPRLEAIVREFGLPFLKKQEEAELRPWGRNQHPIRYHWRVARRFLDGIPPGEKDIRCESLARIVQIADAMEATRNLPGYRKTIIDPLKNHKNWKKFHDTLYELITASIYVLPNICDVEFVVPVGGPDGSRSADLKVTRGAETVWVECARKQRVTPTPWPEFSPRIKEAAKKLHPKIPPGLEVLLLVAGIDEQRAIDFVEGADFLIRQIVASGHKADLWSSFKVGAAIGVRETPEPVIERLQGGTLRSWPAPSGIPVRHYCPHTISGDGNAITPPSPTMIHICLIDSHTIKSIFSSFQYKRTRKQIPEHDLGVLHIDLDINYILPNLYELFLRMAVDLIAEAAWKHGDNKRICAIVLSAADVLTEHQEGEWKFLRPTTIVGIKIRRIPGLPILPDWYQQVYTVRHLVL